MFKFINNKVAVYSAAFTVGVFTTSSAFAGTTTLTNGAQFNLKDLTENVIDSTGSLPGLVSIVAYMSGLALGVLGVLKLKDHVENPTQTPLKDGAVRLGAGGALLALPYLYEVLQTNMAGGEKGVTAQVIQLQGLSSDRTVGD